MVCFTDFWLTFQTGWGEISHFFLYAQTYRTVSCLSKDYQLKTRQQEQFLTIS